MILTVGAKRFFGQAEYLAWDQLYQPGKGEDTKNTKGGEGHEGEKKIQKVVLGISKDNSDHGKGQ
jgi:hypothetical protein